MKESLLEIAKKYVCIVYTASHQTYADSVINYIDPNKDLIQYRLYRHNCVEVKIEKDTMYIKDLRIFNNVKMSDMIIIDNSVMSFAFQLDNGIPILPYYNNPEDNELLILKNYLNTIADSEDLRIQNRKSFKMDYFFNQATNEYPDSSEDSGEEKSNNQEDIFNLIKCKKTEKSIISESYLENDEECSNSNVSDLDNSTFKIVSTVVKSSGNSVTDSVNDFRFVRTAEKKSTIKFKNELSSTLGDLKRSFSVQTNK